MAGPVNPFCLAPSTAAVSEQAIQPTSSNGTVPGNVNPDVRNHKYPFKNQMPDLFQLQMGLVFNLRNQAQLQACLNSITDPTSVYYGNYLNSTTLQPYLPTPSQRASVVQYLTGHGLAVTGGPSPLVLKMSGSALIVSKVFGIGLGFYSKSANSTFYSKSANSTFYSAESDPTLPLNLSTLVGAITGLDNYTSFRHSQSACNSPYCPQGIQVGYSFTNLFTNGFDGTGQKVAIVDEPGDPGIQTAINTYSSQYGLPSITLDLRYPDGTPSSYDPGWASETAMDVEAVHTVAKGAGIVLLYDSVDLMNAVDYVATNNLAKVVSNSWTYGCSGSCSDTQLSSSLVSSVHSRLMADVALGLTICFASGDEGAKPDGTHLGTEFPASDPNVLAIGATDLLLAGSCTNTCTGYGSESGWSGSGGGYSGHFPESSWQTSTIGVKTGRAVPDVSIVGQGGTFWVYSTASDKCGRGGNSAGWFGCGGTSLSTPLWAGFIGILLQLKGAGSFGNIGPLIYQTASGPKYSTIFHDVTSGSNNGYSASTGWDPITGWGTPIANLLAQSLVQVTMFVSYSIIGGGNPTPPIFNYVQGGAPKSRTLTTTSTNVTTDLGSAWSVTPNPLTGSSSSERWNSNQALTGNAAATTILFSFYHQY
ncbi:MAG: S53 family peptidase, partial [Candidatus Bathyarchaeia archaeon]